MKLFAATVCVVLAASAFGTLVPASANVDKKFTTHSTRLARRFDPDELANEEIWKHASCKGGRLIDLMMSSDAEAGPKIEQTMDRNKPSARSEWQGDLRKELQTWGWHEFYIQPAYADMKFWQVESVVEALGINGKPKSEGGNIIPYDVQHWDPDMKDESGRLIDKKDQKYKVDGKEYRVTEARHAFAINPQDGVIFGQFLENPTTAARRIWYRTPNEDELPSLRALSDIFWGYWNRENSNIVNIRYFWMMDIANEDTEQILARALKGVQKTIGVWPGVTFDTTTEAGNAILGSANGAVFAWFLIQHKEQLGNKWIPKVTVFYNDADSEWNGAHLIFHVDTAPEKKTSDDTNMVARAP